MSTPTAPPLTLFYSPGACSFVPHVALCEAGLEFHLVFTKIGHTMLKEFEAVNPKRRVPVLVMGNEVITEMAAVLTAIATVAPEASHGQAIAEIWRTERFTNNIEIYPQLRAKGYETMREIFAHIEAKFIAANITEFAVGSSYTAADSFLAVLYLWTARFTEVTINIDNDYPMYAAYAKKMLERSAFIEARKVHQM
ncbi:hypothetical protein ACHAQJ_000924 [Trichoderma viride]